jgi:putative heme transporter
VKTAGAPPSAGPVPANPAGAGAPGGSIVRWIVAALALAAVGCLWRETLTLLFLSVLFAHLLRPPVDLLARRMPRGMAAGISLAVFLLLLAGAVAWFAPRLAGQGLEFAREMPRILGRVVDQARNLRAGLLERIPAEWGAALEAQIARLMGQVGNFLAGQLVQALGTVRQLLMLVVVPVFSFYLMKDGREIGAWLMRFVPPGPRPAWQRHLEAADDALAAYVRGQGLVCAAQACLLTLALTLIGFPYAFVLGPLAGVAEVVPFLGATVIDILLVVIGLSCGGWMWARGLGIYVALNQVSAYLITPRLVGRTIRVHPLALLVALAAGAEVGGLLGVLFALPLTAVAAASLRTWREDRTAAAAAAIASAPSGGVSASAAGATSPAA